MAAAHPRRLRERATTPRAEEFSSYIRFRESNGLRPAGSSRVYRGVTIIRAGLGNRKDRNYYSEPALREAVAEGMFDKLRAFADHPTSVDEEIQPERTIRDLIGVYENPRFVEARAGRPGEVQADLRVLRSQKWLSETVDELLEHGLADKIGISINGNGRTSPKTIQESGEALEVNEVTKFLRLKSADVVTEAGAGGGWHQLRESARGGLETSMKPKSATILQQLRECVEKGDVAGAKKLNKQLAKAEASEAAEEQRRAAAAQEADDLVDDDDLDGDDEDDAEDELDAAVAEVKEAADDPDEDEGDEDDADEGEDDEDEGDEDDAEGDEPPVKESRGQQDDRAARMRAAIAKQKQGLRDAKPGERAAAARQPTPVQEARRMRRKGKIHGVPEMGVSSFVRPARESAEVRRLRRENEQLREGLNVYKKADAARRLLKESALDPDLHGPMVRRLVRNCRTIEAMQEEITFQERLLESAGNRATDIMFDDAVEGAGAKFREGFLPADDEGGDSLLESARELGIPMRDDE